MNANLHQRKSWRVRVVAFAQAQRCLVLLISLFALLGLYPYLGGDADKPPFLLRLLTSVVLVGGVYAVSRTRGQFVLAMLFFVLGMLGNWMPDDPGQTKSNLLVGIARLMFYLVMIIMLLSYVLRSRTVTGDRLAGAFCAYLLIGVMFAWLYALLHMLAPAAFSFSNLPDAEGSVTGSQFLFFSFVTLSTLGYGDITPVTSKAQSLAIMEAIIGVMYMAGFVAWIVSTLRLSKTPGRECYPGKPLE